MVQEYFTDRELECPCCGEHKFSVATRERLNRLRELVGPIIVNSAYRCSIYNGAKGYTQTHASGQAMDIKCSHKQAFLILEHAPSLGFTGIGVKQKGNTRFIHLDDLEEELPKRPRPHIWSY